MTSWNKIVFRDFEYDEAIEEKLHAHKISFSEAVECFYNPFIIRRNKKFKDRFQLIGNTDSGRQLKIIFQLKKKDTVRIITGWDI